MTTKHVKHTILTPDALSGYLLEASVDAKVQAALASEPTVVAAAESAAADAVDANPTIASLQAVTPATTGQPGQATIYGPTSPKFADMETVIFDHVFERSATPATNRANLQTLLDRVKPTGTGKQARLFIPPRFDGSGNPDPIVVDKAGANAWCVDVPSGVTIEGAGAGSAVKVQDALPAGATRIFSVWGKSDVTFRNLRIDGNEAANNVTYEQNHCIFIYDSERVLVEDVKTVNATGDGVSVSGTTGIKSRDIHLNRLRSTGHQRNPVTVEQADDVWITNSHLIVRAGSPGQAIDSEPYENVTTGRLYIMGNVLGHDSDGLVLTFGGRSASYPRRNIVVSGNEFRGGTIYGVYAENAIFAHNTGTIQRMYLPGHIRNFIASANVLDITTTNQFAMDALWSLGATPEGVQFIDNDITLVNGGGGLRFGGVRSGIIRGGHIRGNGVDTGYAAISVTATQNMEDISITGTTIENVLRPVRLAPSGGTTMTGLTLGGFTIDGSMSGVAAVDLYSPVNWITNLVVLPSMIRNAMTAPFAINGATPFVMSGTPGYAAVWSVGGTPEGQITERVGAVAYRRDGGAGTTMYVKESGTGNTGWVAK